MPGQAPPHPDERDLLLAFLEQQRDGIRYAAYGLTDNQARLTPSVSALSVGGLVKHVADMERNWADLVEQIPDDGSNNSAYEDGFRLGADETLAGALARYDAATARTNAVVADIVRESIDGASMYELMAGAEGWPATDWLQPWQPAV